MDGDEKVLAVVPFVSASPVRLVDRLAYTWKRPFAPRYGHLILTNRRLTHIRVSRSRKITEVRRELVFSGTVGWKGLEGYTTQDLSADVMDSANLDIPLSALGMVHTSGRNDSALELMAAMPGRQIAFRFFLLAGLYDDHLGGSLPVGSGGSMAPVADMIRRAKAGHN